MAAYTADAIFVVWFLVVSLGLNFILFACGLLVLPILFVSVFVGVCGVLLVSAFMLCGSSANRSTSPVKLAGVQVVACGIFILLLSFVFVSVTEPTFSGGGFYEYSSRSTQMLVQKFLFFNSDLLCFFILFDCFFWGI